MKQLNRLLLKVSIGLFLTVLFVLFYHFTLPGKMIEARLYDKRFELRGIREADSDIVIVAIDNFSLEELDSWPWPRNYYAEIIKLLNSYGAKVIAFDVIFNKYSREPEKDKLFADEIKKAGNVVLGSMFTGGLFGKSSSSSNRIQEGLSYTIPEPYEEMLLGDLSYGIVNLRRDADKSVRWGQLLHPLEDLIPSTQSLNSEWEPHFTMQIMKSYNPEKAKDIQDKYWNKQFLINFAGPPRTTYKTVSFSNVLKGTFLEVDSKNYNEFFKDKIVLIGATAEIFHDTISTPFTYGYAVDQMPGVEVHAAILDTVLNNIKYEKASDNLNNSIIFGAGLLSTAAFISFNPFIGLIIGLIAASLYTFLNIFLFLKINLWLDLFAPIGVIVFVFAGIYSYRFLIEEKEKRRVRSVFKRYMSPALVEEALKDPDKVPSLDICAKKFVSILFSDIAGFTTMSEKFPPEEVKRILDEYLTAMTEIVFSNNGVLDKYIGDAIMAVYGNLGSSDPADDAFRVVKTAVEMQDKMIELRQKWVAEGSIAMQIRIGIHSGEALIGNFGSPLKMDYTAIGDTVNTASRLEGMNKEFGSLILISHDTYQLIAERINVRNLGPAPVKGKSEAIHVYEVLGITDNGEGKMIEDKNNKQTRWIRQSNSKETKWARGNNETNWN